MELEGGGGLRSTRYMRSVRTVELLLLVLLMSHFPVVHARLLFIAMTCAVPASMGFGAAEARVPMKASVSDLKRR